MAQELWLNELHRQAGATFGQWQDWLVPWRFGSPEEEYRAIRRGAGLIDYSAWGLLEIRGADRISFLHNLLTNDLKILTPGAGCEAGLLTPNAKLLADLVVLADADAHWILVTRSCSDTVLKTLERYLITEDVTFYDRTSTHALIALQGPNSIVVLNQALAMQPAFQKSLDHATLTSHTAALRVIAHSFTGEPGVLITVQAEHAASLWQRLLERGRPHGLAPIGWEALNVLRIEAGIPWHGVDMDESNLLPETGLEEHAVSYTKGCYVGQEVVARLQTYGAVSRKLMGLICDGQEVPRVHDPITKDGEPLGQITSACFSPALNQPIAMGYVKRPFYEAGTVVAVIQGNHALAAKLVKRPFIKLRTGDKRHETRD